MAIVEYQCSCSKKYAVEKDLNGRIKRVSLTEFDNPNDPNALYKCSQCQNELIPSGIKSVVKATENQPGKILKAVAVTKANLNKEPENAEMLRSLGLLYLLSGNYQDAVKTLEKAKDNDPLNASTYFYIAIAMLNGKIARLSPRPTIETIVNNLNSAIEFEEEDEKKALYKCLYAYIQYDFFESRYMLTKPSSSSLISEVRELGVDAEELDDLFIMLRVSKPAILR